jgi:hypothetical protein
VGGVGQAGGHQGSLLLFASWWCPHGFHTIDVNGFSCDGVVYIGAPLRASGYVRVAGDCKVLAGDETS